jgi:hypothetical protein
MAANEAELLRLLEVHLSVHGFNRLKKMWYLETDECYSLIEVDKGTWRTFYYLELNVVIKALMTRSKPSQMEGGLLGWNVEVLVPDPLKIRTAMSLADTSITNKEKDTLIVTALEEYAIPFLKRVSTLEGLKEELRQNKLMRYHTSAALWGHLKLDIPRNPKLDQ